MIKELCWNLTNICNQNCIYCFRDQHRKALSVEDNLQILKYLNSIGINEITWSGGEPLLYDGLHILLKQAYNYKIKNKLNSNGSLFLNKVHDIIDYVDDFTFSLDSNNNVINKQLGRGFYHKNEIEKAINYLSNNHPNKPITINVVITQFNLHHSQELIKYLNNLPITSVRVFQVSPIRDRSIETYNSTKIDIKDFNKVIQEFKENLYIPNVSFRTRQDLDNKYLIISPNGQFGYSKNGKDIFFKNLKEIER